MNALDPAERERKRRRHRNERIAAAVLVVVSAVIAFAVVRWNLRERQELGSDRTYIPREVKITREVAMLRELVRIDSSKPEGVATAAQWVLRYLRSNGIQAEVIESAPNMVNVYARIRGRSRGAALLLFNHLDVVEPGPGWSHPPFEAAIVGDQLIGRGTVDMKALAVAQLAAFVELAKSGRQPEHDLVYLSTCDEETGGRWGMQWLLAHRPDIFADVRYGITEGGITEIMRERMTYFGIEIGGKQYVTAQVSAPSREALQKTRIALEPWIFSRTPGRLLPEVRTFFAQLAPTRVQFRGLLADIDGTMRRGQFWRLPPTYRDLVQNSLVTGAPMKRDDAWTMEVIMSNLPDEHPDQRIAWLSQTIAPTGARIIAVPVKEGPVPLSSANSPLFRILANEAARRYEVQAGVQILYRSSSDARFLRPRGIEVYGLCPYPVTYYQSVAIHRANEAITVWAFQEGVEYLRSVTREWAQAQ